MRVLTTAAVIINFFYKYGMNIHLDSRKQTSNSYYYSQITENIATKVYCHQPSVLCCYWIANRKSIWPVRNSLVAKPKDSLQKIL